MKYILTFVATVFLGLILGLLVFPILSLIGLLVYVVRKLVIWIVQYHKPHWGKMLPARSSIMIGERLSNFWTENTNSIVFGVLIEQPVPTAQALISVYRERVMLLRDEYGNLMYPEFKQSLDKFLGYYFWTPVQDFALEDVITLRDNGDNTMTLEELDNYLKELTLKPFEKGKPLWEIILVPKVESGMGVVVFREHHCLADGSTAYKMMQQLTKESPPLYGKVYIPVSTKNTSFIEKLAWFLWLLRMPFDLASFLLTLPSMRNVWKREQFQSNSENASSRIFYMACSEESHWSRFNDIKCSRGLHSATSVLLAAVAGALKTKVNDNQNVALTIPLPLPVKHHPLRLRNNMSSVTVSLPIRGDVDQRLELVDKAVKEALRSTLPLVNFLGAQLAGSCFPAWLGPYFHSLARNSEFAFMTSFKTPKHFKEDCNDFIGQKVVGIRLATNMVLGYRGFITEKDRGHLTVIGGPSVFSNEVEPKNLIRLYEQELLDLEKSS